MLSQRTNIPLLVCRASINSDPVASRPSPAERMAPGFVTALLISCVLSRTALVWRPSGGQNCNEACDPLPVVSLPALNASYYQTVCAVYLRPKSAQPFSITTIAPCTATCTTQAVPPRSLIAGAVSVPSLRISPISSSQQHFPPPALWRARQPGKY